MEILIITEDRKTESQLLRFIDQVIAEEKLHHLDIISGDFCSLSFNNVSYIDKCVFILIDIRVYPDVRHHFNQIRHRYPYCELGIISGTYQQAVSILNNTGKIQGCIAVRNNKINPM